MKNIKTLSIICISLLQTACMGLPTSKSTGNFPKPSVPSNLKDMPYEKWQDTESGRFAHSLQYEDKLAKPVPYTFTEGKDYRQESIDYFEHLCKTEGKDYIYKTVTGVDTIAQLRSFEIPFERQNNPNWGPQSYRFHPYALESPVFFNENLGGLIDNMKQNKEPLSKVSFDAIRRFYALGYSGYEVVFNNAEIYQYNRDYKKASSLDRKILSQEEIDILINSVSKNNNLISKYGFTWKGFSRPQDRDYGIAGGDLIILDLITNEIIAIQRTFIKGSIQRNSSSGLNWEGVGCFEQYKNHLLHTDKDFTNKDFVEKAKLINYASPNSRISPSFIHNVLKPLNK
jgi:hypothetical protein